MLIQHYQTSKREHSPSEVQVSIMVWILKILGYVYENKYMKGAPLTLLYTHDINQVFSKSNELASRLTGGSAPAAGDANPKVPSAIDLKESFETFFDAVH